MESPAWRCHGARAGPHGEKPRPARTRRPERRGKGGKGPSHRCKRKSGNEQISTTSTETFTAPALFAATLAHRGKSHKKNRTVTDPAYFANVSVTVGDHLAQGRQMGFDVDGLLAVLCDRLLEALQRALLDPRRSVLESGPEEQCVRRRRAAPARVRAMFRRLLSAQHMGGDAAGVRAEENRRP